MINDYLAVGENEVVNHARLQAYLTNVWSPLDSGASVCTCPALTAAVLDDTPYTTPDDPASPAPWFDEDVPDSADFLGVMVLAMDGVDDYPITRAVTSAVSGSGSIGPRRVKPRTITVRAVLLATSCCGVQYGLHWLGEALQGCNGGICAGDCATMYHCCPAAGMTAEDFNAAYRRTFRRVALTSGPTVVARHSDGPCSTGKCSGNEVVTVEFVLTAGSPWAWTDTVPIIEVDLPGDDSNDCVTWCLPVFDEPFPAECGGPCPYAACVPSDALCDDPRNVAPDPPEVELPVTAFCLGLATERDCYNVRLEDRPGWSEDALMILLKAGDTPLRNVRITFYEKNLAQIDTMTCQEVADANRCNQYMEFNIMYVPAGGGVTLDGQVGRAMLECSGDCGPSRDTYGANGSPPLFKTLTCGRYCICIETDVNYPPGEGASLSLGVSGRGL